MALVKKEIIRAIKDGTWKAYRDGVPIGADDLKIGPNSVDLTLSHRLIEVTPAPNCLWVDPRDPSTMAINHVNLEARDEYVLYPGQLVLGAVRESFNCTAPVWIEQTVQEHDETGYYFAGKRLLLSHYYQVIDGRSTIGRIGLSVHTTAGRGDWGFDGAFTLELTATVPVVLFAGMRLAQMYFEPLHGTPHDCYDGAYRFQSLPTVSALGDGRV